MIAENLDGFPCFAARRDGLNEGAKAQREAVNPATTTRASVIAAKVGCAVENPARVLGWRRKEAAAVRSIEGVNGREHPVRGHSEYGTAAHHTIGLYQSAFGIVPSAQFGWEQKLYVHTKSPLVVILKAVPPYSEFPA